MITGDILLMITNFKMREKKPFKYDILLYGFINKVAYPLRVKFFEVLQFLNQRSNLRIKHIPHPSIIKELLIKCRRMKIYQN